MDAARSQKNWVYQLSVLCQSRQGKRVLHRVNLVTVVRLCMLAGFIGLSDGTMKVLFLINLIVVTESKF